uniref:ARAD1B11660p n=1 Tax=Blastobotrys adeninivorans TaxID=409370 RepID=A0A060TB03_BLAAD
MEDFAAVWSSLLSQDDSATEEQAAATDKRVVSLLTAAGAAYSSKIFEDFYGSSAELEAKLWSDVFGPALTAYRGRLKSGQPAGADGDRLIKVLKVLSRFYREYIKRTIELEGATDFIRPLIPVLKMDLAEDSIKNAPSAVADRLTDSIKRSLCKLGDFARYKATVTEEGAPKDYSYARIYYRCAISISPGEGTAYNQMGSIEASAGNLFDAMMWFLRSQCVEKPFGYDNVSKIAKRVFKSDVSALAKTIAGGKDGSKEVAKILHAYSGFYLYQIEFGRKKGSVQVDSKAAVLAKVIDTIEGTTLIDIALMGVLLTFLTDRFSGSEFRGDPASSEVLGVTVAIFGIVMDAAMRYWNAQDTDSLSRILPCLRVYFDWFSKYVAHDVAWEQVGSHYRSLLEKMYLLVDGLRKRFGFKFDALTAVKMLSGKRALLALEEEKKCLGLLPFEGALNDTPSGLDAKQLMEQSLICFQGQCLLFSALELARLGWTDLEFDESSNIFKLKGFHLSGQPQKEDEEDEEDEEEEEIVFKPRTIAI